MESVDIDWLISNAPMDPFVFDDANNWNGDIDWSLVDNLNSAAPSATNCVQYPEMDKGASQGFDVSWEELLTFDPLDMTLDEPDSLFGQTAPSSCEESNGTPSFDVHEDIRELRQAIADIQGRLSQLDNMYLEMKEESERSLSCILLLEDYALKLMEWTSDFKAQVDKIGERLDTYQVE